MENYFDQMGRDKFIHDWLKRCAPGYVNMYEYVLAKYGTQPEINQLLLLAFEAGIDLAMIQNTGRGKR